MELKAKFKSQQAVVDRGNFKSRKVWVITEDNPQYPQTIEVEVQQDKVDMFSNLQEGTPLTLHCNLRGREWTKPETGITSVFNSIIVWKIDGNPNPVGNVTSPVKEDAEDDLPF